MTPKAKAKELVDKFQGKEFMEVCNSVFGKQKIDFLTFTEAKQCALICQQEKIDILKEIRTFMGLDICWIEKEQKVKQEIEKL